MRPEKEGKGEKKSLSHLSRFEMRTTVPGRNGRDLGCLGTGGCWPTMEEIAAQSACRLAPQHPTTNASHSSSRVWRLPMLGPSGFGHAPPFLSSNSKQHQSVLERGEDMAQRNFGWMEWTGWRVSHSRDTSTSMTYF